MATPPHDDAPGPVGPTEERVVVTDIRTDDTADGAGTPRAALAAGGLAGVGALIGAIVKILLARRRRRQQAATPLARAARAATEGAHVVSGAMLPVLVLGGKAAAEVGTRAADVGTRAARSGARGAAGATRTGLASTGRAVTAAGKGASGVAGGLSTVAGGLSGVAGGLGDVGRGGLRTAHRASGAVTSVPETVAEQGHRLHKRWRKLVRAVTFVLGLGAGFVAGARAGRERFEELKQAAARLTERPEVRQAKQRMASSGESSPSQGGDQDATATGTGGRA